MVWVGMQKKKEKDWEPFWRTFFSADVVKMVSMQREELLPSPAEKNKGIWHKACSDIFICVGADSAVLILWEAGNEGKEKNIGSKT